MSEPRDVSDAGGMWLVRLPQGGMRAMTLSQLDDAFQRDEIGISTQVLEHGGTEWKTLGALLGEDVATAPTPSNAPSPQADNPPFVADSSAPIATDATDADVDLDVELEPILSRKKRVRRLYALGIAAGLVGIGAALLSSIGHKEQPSATATPELAPPPPAPSAVSASPSPPSQPADISKAAPAPADSRPSVELKRAAADDEKRGQASRDKKKSRSTRKAKGKR